MAGKTLQQARVGLLIAQFEALPEVCVCVRARESVCVSASLFGTNTNARFARTLTYIQDFQKKALEKSAERMARMPAGSYLFVCVCVCVCVCVFSLVLVSSSPSYLFLSLLNPLHAHIFFQFTCGLEIK